MDLDCPKYTIICTIYPASNWDFYWSLNLIKTGSLFREKSGHGYHLQTLNWYDVEIVHDALKNTEEEKSMSIFKSVSDFAALLYCWGCKFLQRHCIHLVVFQQLQSLFHRWASKPNGNLLLFELHCVLTRILIGLPAMYLRQSLGEAQIGVYRLIIICIWYFMILAWLLRLDCTHCRSIKPWMLSKKVLESSSGPLPSVILALFHRSHSYSASRLFEPKKSIIQHLWRT